MRVFHLTFFVFLLSCGTLTKEYVCGDRPCIDKKEFEEYFAENLTVEITSINKRKKKNSDLVKINIDSDTLNKQDDKSLNQKEKNRKKIAKEELKAEKIRLKEERKIKKAEEKLTKKQKNEAVKKEKAEKKQKKIIKKKVSKNSKQTNPVVDNIKTKKINKKSVLTREIQIDTVENKNVHGLCDEIEDCDINKIAEMLIKKGKDKPFPNISSN
jgi:hypothetical protein